MKNVKKPLAFVMLAMGLSLTFNSVAASGLQNPSTNTLSAVDYEHELYQQVAASLGVSVGTVHQRVNSGQYTVLEIRSDVSIKLVMMDENNNLLGEIVIG